MNIILNKKKINFFTILVIILLSLLPTLANATIVTMFKPLGFIAAAIADGITTVEVITPNGTTIHNYSLRPLDIMKIKNSDFVILIGNNAEPIFLKKIIDHLKKKYIELISKKRIKSLLICNSKCFIDKKKQKNTLQNNYQINNISYDMHIWLSPEIALESATIIHNMLITIMPKKKILIEKNFKKFKRSLLALDNTIRNNFVSIKQKKYFIFHDAYKYFETYYKLHPVGYFKKYPGIQTGARSLYEIRNQLIDKKAICIFTEPQFNADIIDVIIRGTKVHKGFLDPLGVTIPLSKDSYLKFLLQLSNQYVRCLKIPQGIK
ncbi:zinc ABC transporter substrate-binding protein ZnuA [Buchnera aphidicola]|nr:zinc ABC transporter substrate-binding protein ZnuA [Buchnera aphidicola]